MKIRVVAPAEYGEGLEEASAMATPSPDVRVAHLQRSGAKRNQCANRKDGSMLERRAPAVQAPWSGLPAEVACSDRRGRKGSAAASAQSDFWRGRMSDHEHSDWKPIGSAARSLVAKVARRVEEANQRDHPERRRQPSLTDADMADATSGSDSTTNRRAPE